LFALAPGLRFAGTVARHPMHRLGGFFAEPRPFLPGDHVTTEQGTGLVHMAPDHGEEDFLVCKAAGIDPVFAVEDDGKYRNDWLWLGGLGSVINNKFNAPDGPICADLKREALAASPISHSYPHSWRSRPRSSTAARRNGSSDGPRARWAGRRRCATALARSTTHAGCQRNPRTGSARWSRGGRTG
jgi:hypothetical protein